MKFFSFFPRIKLRLSPQFSVSKRQRFALVSLVLSLGFVFVQLIDIEYRYLSITFLSVVAYFLSAWALREELAGVEWVTLLLLPSIFTMAVGLFYFLIPVRWATRLPAVGFYAIGLYAILLTENIYNVAASRTIGLLRAASSIGFLMTLITSFLLFDTILAFKQDFILNSILSMLVTFPLSISFIWSIKLEEWVSREVLLYSLACSVTLGEMAVAISFWPLSTTMSALFLTTCLYVLLAFAQYHFLNRLIEKMILELLIVSSVVFLMIIISGRWGG